MPAAAYQEMVDYVTKAAIARGIDPRVAVRVAQAEALNVFDPSKPDMGGDDHSSFGLYQLHYGGLSKAMPNPGLGDEFTKVTGLDARDPSTWRQQVDFSLDYASKHGWGSWMGAKNNGIDDWAGIGRRTGGPVEAAGGGAGSDVAAPTLYNTGTGGAPQAQPTDVASAFSFINTRDDEPIPLIPSRERSLADDLSDSVAGGNERRQAADTDSGLLYGPEDETAQTSPIDFGVPPTAETREQAPPAPTATSPSSSAQPSLADLFTVKDIGQAAMVDPRTGVPVTGRKRRAYG